MQLIYSSNKWSKDAFKMCKAMRVKNNAVRTWVVIDAQVFSKKVGGTADR